MISQIAFLLDKIRHYLVVLENRRPHSLFITGALNPINGHLETETKQTNLLHKAYPQYISSCYVGTAPYNWSIPEKNNNMIIVIVVTLYEYSIASVRGGRSYIINIIITFYRKYFVSMRSNKF